VSRPRRLLERLLAASRRGSRWSPGARNAVPAADDPAAGDRVAEDRAAAQRLEEARERLKRTIDPPADSTIEPGAESSSEPRRDPS
jgi:hypothetical protein